LNLVICKKAVNPANANSLKRDRVIGLSKKLNNRFSDH
jgi:hypothetical protein